MSRKLNLLRSFLWETPHSGPTDEKQRIKDLESGIIKFCGGLKLLDSAFQSEEIIQLRLELFSLVKNAPEPKDPAAYIAYLESRVDQATDCLEKTKSDVHSERLRTLRLYLIALRRGDPNPSAIEPGLNSIQESNSEDEPMKK